MDILGFKVNMLDEQKGIYVSSLGNINTYTVYVGAVLVVSMILFCLEKNRKKMFWVSCEFCAFQFCPCHGHKRQCVPDAGGAVRLFAAPAFPDKDGDSPVHDFGFGIFYGDPVH